MATGKRLVFVRKGKQVALVVILKGAIGLHPDKPVKKLPIFLQHQAARNNAFFLLGNGAHPVNGPTVCSVFSVFSGLHTKTGTEGFG